MTRDRNTVRNNFFSTLDNVSLPLEGSGTVVVPLLFDTSVGAVPFWLFDLVTTMLIYNNNNCLFDLMLYVHDKQLRSCWDG